MSTQLVHSALARQSCLPPDPFACCSHVCCLSDRHLLRACLRRVTRRGVVAFGDQTDPRPDADDHEFRLWTHARCGVAPHDAARDGAVVAGLGGILDADRRTDDVLFVCNK